VTVPTSTGNCLVHTVVPIAILKQFRDTNLEPSDEVALETFRQRISASQTSPMGQPAQRAPGFDYVRWKPHGQQRKHHNPDEYIQTCQGLAPYTSSVAMSSWEGLEERRWAGLTQAPPEIPGMPIRSGYTSAGSRSNLGSREIISK